ncbi:rab GTPase-binding effector protein 1 isoform X2 [Vanessa cardui]|uniref:rab GTPase-binding effector protein 1 isoform X2 n=1 Tax=Vanessa cardui TaxID=171605 RepID=UPI001F13C694|nr:rab GTPase-binding effector protein 1 isoform X2 [Vanessa cardui]
MDETTMSKESTVMKDGCEGGSATGQARRDLEEEFNMQRAKMKELFLQKEEDLRKLVLEKQQLDSEVLGLRAEVQQLQILSENQKSEIQNLQLLVSETVEASSSGTEEVRRLQARNIELEQQLAQLRQQQQELSLAPATFVRSLARKLTADSDADHASSKKCEDNELLRSIIQPLELEITALKNKLRENDAQLQEALKAKASAANANSGGDAKAESERGGCDMCANYERQLVAEQARADAARERAHTHQRALALATDELEGVRSVHDETIRSWQAERAGSAARLAELAGALRDARDELAARARDADAASQRALQHVTTLTVQRETLQRKLDALERDNALLVGHYTRRAAEMQSEVINLPDSVAELQELNLQLREQLIVCETGRERAADAEQELRAQLLQHAALLHRREGELAQRDAQLRQAQEELDRLQTEREQMKELADKLRHSNDMIEQLLDDKKRLQTEVSEVRQRVGVLQQELDNSEKVQQDFVRLSQSLQVQLQRIREEDTEVRWQHDEDVNECPACHTALPTVKKKVHCRHCGRIYCGACVSHSVASGPRGLPARVCSVCLTLLQPHAAPYFSTRPPHSPD